MPATHRTGYVASPAPLYYDWFGPTRRDHPTIVMVHGGCFSGACYLGTPDGRPGWAHDFLDHGYGVVVPDWPGVGRSGSVAEDALSAELVCAALGALLDRLARPVVLLVHSMSGAFGFRLVETHGHMIDALVAIAPAPPGNIQELAVVGTETDTEIEIIGPAARWTFPKSGQWQATEQFIQDKLIGRGSTRFPRHALDTFRAALLPLSAQLLLQRQNLHNTQVRVDRPDNFVGMPTLLLTGDADLEHPRKADGATAVWLAELGADVEFRYLADSGITGNGHMLMLEDNSAEIATSIVRWLRKKAVA